MAEKTRVSLCADLLRAVFEENKELLLELQIKDALGSYEKVHPALSELRIDDKLVVDANKVPDTDATVNGTLYLIQKIQGYMEIFVGNKEAGERIANSVAKFEQTNSEDIERTGLRISMPEIFGTEQKESPLDIDTVTEMEKARKVFQDIFSYYLENDADDEKKSTLVKHLGGCDAIASVSPDASQFEFAEDATLSALVGQLSGVVEALSISPDVIEVVFGEYGKLPEELGISQTLFGGTLSTVTRFGVSSIDTLLRSGLERDATLLLEGPAAVERDIITYLFLKACLDEGGSVIFTTTLRSPDRIRSGLSSVGVDVATIETEERLIIVDWYTRHMKHITGIEEYANLIVVSNDLTNLAVGIDIALKKTVKCPSRRLVLDLVSPTIVVEGFERVNEFLSAIKAKLRNSKCTGLITFNPHMHVREDIDVVEDIFDGILSISRSITGGRMRSMFHISSYAPGPFDSSQILLDINEKGIAISDTSQTFREEERIAFDHSQEKFSLGFPGIENLTAGGLPRGRSFLIWTPSKITQGEIIKPLLMETVQEEHSVLLALSTVTTDEITSWLDEIGHSSSRLIEKNALEIVDWQAQKDSRILGVEEFEGIIRASKDITHLGVGLDLALRKIDTSTSSLAVLETLSPAFRIFDFGTVYQFAQVISARLNRKGFTTFVVMERDAHDSKINAGVEEIFDCVLDVMAVGDHLELAVLNQRDAHFLPEYRKLSRLRTGFSVDLTAREAPAEAVSDISGDLDARIDQLDRELKDALETKTALEKKTAELMEREDELQSKHAELRDQLAELERKIEEQQSELEAAPAEREATRDEAHLKELARILHVLDDMLEHLPEDMIEKFANSDEFKLYEKIINIYLEDQ